MNERLEQIEGITLFLNEGMDSADRVKYNDAAIQIVEWPQLLLDRMVDVGLIVKFNTGKGGHGVAYGLPLGEHQHVWHMPEAVDRRNMSPANEFIYLTWYCELPGCKATMQTIAYLAEKDK
jgi:hypothetical protein